MTTTHRSSRLAAAALALLLVSGIAACGASGGDDAGSDDKATTTVASGGGTTTADDDESDDDVTTTEADDDDDGGDDDGSASGSEQDYVDALVSTFDEEEEGEVFSQDQVQCLAERWVGEIGVDRFQDAGISPADIADDDSVLDSMNLDEATARKMVAGFEDCDINLRDLMLDQVASQGIDDDQRQCLESVFTEDAIAESFVQDIIGNDDAEDPLDAASDCFLGSTDDATD